MKIRMGFVTNSSSTSFIVAFDRDITSKDDVRTAVRDMADKHGMSSITSGYLSYDSANKDTWDSTIDMLSDYLWYCIGPRIHPSDHDPELCYECEACEAYHDDPWYCNHEDNTYRVMLEKLIAEHQDKYIYHVIVGDDDMVGTCLEHGDLLRLMPHIAISMH
jgi:hypothetical protein